MSPKGSFAVDWGDGTIDNIDRDNTTATDYTHIYATGGVKTIKFCGRATEYNSATGDSVVVAISFYKIDSNNTSKWIASISGSMGSVLTNISLTAVDFVIFFKKKRKPHVETGRNHKN